MRLKETPIHVLTVLTLVSLRFADYLLSPTLKGALVKPSGEEIALFFFRGVWLVVWWILLVLVVVSWLAAQFATLRSTQ